MPHAMIHFRRLPAAIILCAAALAAATAAAAAQEAPCFEAPYYDLATKMSLDADRPLAANLCIHDLREGRAAVLLPPPGQDIDDVAADPALGAHRWGFLDRDGRLAIPPRFESVDDFHGGRAAARDGGKWGYLDPQGQWALPPRFDWAGPFTTLGLAAVMQDGRFRLIDRSGKPVGPAFGDDVARIFLQDGDPGLVQIQYKPAYLLPTGERRYAVDGVKPVQSFGEDLFIAAAADGRYGLADGAGRWRLEPEYDEIDAPMAAGRLGVANGTVLIRPDGSVIARDYWRVQPLGPGFWLAADGQEDAGFDLLGAAGEVLRKLDRSAADDLRQEGSYLLLTTAAGLEVYVPGLAKPVVVPKGLEPVSSYDDTGFLFFRAAPPEPGDGGEDRIAGILAPRGQWIGGAHPPAWLARVAKAEAVQGRLWLWGDYGTPVAIIDPEGRAVLGDKAAATLANYAVEPLRNSPGRSVPPTAIAVIGQNHCQCAEGAGLLLSNGDLVLKPHWQKVVPLDDETRDVPADGLRFAVETAEGTGLLDQAGKPLLAPDQDHIGPFRFGYALAYRDGVSRLLDRRGKLSPLPDVFEAEVAGPGVVRFHETAAEDAPWGLYDIASRRVVVPPRFRAIGDFADGLAVASLGPGQVGVIDGQGRWALPARFGAVHRLNDHLWRVEASATAGADDDETPAEVVDSSGREIVPFRRGLDVTAAEDGKILASVGYGDDRENWLLLPDGTPVNDDPRAEISQIGRSWEIVKPPQQGYVDAAGIWSIPPATASGSTFDAMSGLALQRTGRTNRLIDRTGRPVAELPAGQWSWPPASPWLLARDSADGKPVTRYADARGRPTLSVPGSAGLFRDRRAVLIREDGQATWIDEQGRPAEGLAFADLGLPAGGLAYAAADGEHYGYVEADGRFAIPPVYGAVSSFADDRAVASTADASMVIDTTGRPLARVTMRCGVRVLYGAGNTRIWPEQMPSRCRGI
ncbi:WG repeat-containing protein [Inquilinus limosus]|uniref:WG repeat-containing protein n=1 Tax=Inquilinus limosus TaxID=171674 RepID=UPI00068C9D94|nr:WG repeat-containing protein [Inquilinus limosus]